jgi:hypothetical protein
MIIQDVVALPANSNVKAVHDLSFLLLIYHWFTVENSRKWNDERSAMKNVF